MSRVITKSSYHTKSNYLLDVLGWDRVSVKKANRNAIRVFKAPNNLAPDYLTRIFKDREAPCEKRLAIPKPWTNYMKRSFSYRETVLWNKLSVELQTAASLREFKKGSETSDL